MLDSLEQRAGIHAALGDRVRLAIVDELRFSDRSPKDLAHTLGIAPNLLAHHLDVLTGAGLVTRSRSAGDRRRSYVRLVTSTIDRLTAPADRPTIPERVLFVCTQNSARSPLAAALWRRITGSHAASAGTHPADAVHPGAVAAARRAHLDLGDATPSPLDAATAADLVVTVCDRAGEELSIGVAAWHWSIADPAEANRADAFDQTITELDRRIRSLA